jgi:hypothetical protein
MVATFNNSNQSSEWDIMAQYNNLLIYPPLLMEKSVFWFNIIGSMIIRCLLVKITKVEEVKFSSIQLSTLQVSHSSMDLILHQLNTSPVCMLWKNWWLLSMLIKNLGLLIEKEVLLSMLWTMILSNLKSLMNLNLLIVQILVLLMIGLEVLVSLVMPISPTQTKLEHTDSLSHSLEMVCLLSTSNGLKVENQLKYLKSNSLTWKNSCLKLICLYLMLLFSQLSP